MPILLEEYRECSSNIRHYSTLRFHCLTVFAAINAGLLAANEYTDTWAMPLAGIAVSGVLLFAEIQINRYISLFQSEAAAIEQELGMALWASRKGLELVQSRNHVVPVVYGLVIALWLVLGVPYVVDADLLELN